MKNEKRFLNVTRNGELIWYVNVVLGTNLLYIYVADEERPKAACRYNIEKKRIVFSAGVSYTKDEVKSMKKIVNRIIDNFDKLEEFVNNAA